VSVAVDIGALGGRLVEYGDRAYLVTVTDDGVPHVVSVLVALEGDRLVTSVGRRTGANLAARPHATFLWPPPGGDGDFSLIVDGTAVAPAGEGRLTVTPTAAVLHRVAGAATDGPTCLPVTPG
jgi:Pyridoxamine 5'-phosphate oxidase